MKPISVERFNALAGYARTPRARIDAEEVGWFEHSDGRVLGTAIRDREDDDFGGVVFARDQLLRFRAVNVTHFAPTRRRGEVALRRAMEEAAAVPPEAHHQGDERGPPVDFFAYRRPVGQLNPDFVQLAEQEGYTPARGIIEPMMRWYEDVDGNFIEQFQTTGFDQRIWELYLFAAFTEMGYWIGHGDPAPDFLCAGYLGSLAVEAVTVGPTREGGKIIPPPPLDTPEAMRAYLSHYMPIKYGSALFSKLRRSYWELPTVARRPFFLAIEDFSSPASMTHSRTAIDTYLYGHDYSWETDGDGKLTITPRKIESHQWGDKVIPSGFFDLPGAENVSGVLFSNSGTIAKFNRMGVLAGFGSPRVLVVREGTRVNHDPNSTTPIFFRRVVNAPDYTESWVEGLDVFHNPRALIPAGEHLFPGAAHHYIREDGTRISRTPDWHPLGSFTRQFVPVNVETALAEMAERPVTV